MTIVILYITSINFAFHQKVKSFQNDPFLAIAGPLKGTLLGNGTESFAILLSFTTVNFQTTSLNKF